MTNKHPLGNTSFDTPTLQYALDSTSLGMFKTCPKNYYYSMIEGWRPKKMPVPLAFGIAYHKALETYDIEIFGGADREAAIRSALRVCMEAPIPEDPKENRDNYTLARSVLWYLETFNPDACETVKLANGKPAVELSFKLNLNIKTPSGRSYLLCGHFDRVCRYANQTWILDRKTTSMGLTSFYFDQFNPSNQMSLYNFASALVLSEPVAGVIIDAAHIVKTVTHFQRGFTKRSQSQLDEWYADICATIKQMEACSIANHWPCNDTACSHYGGCKFRDICSKDKSVRQFYLEDNFKKEVWDPLVSREVE